MTLAANSAIGAPIRVAANGAISMMWHVVFAEDGRLPQSRAVKSRDHAIQVACELLAQSLDVRRILEPHGSSIERPELDAHFDEGRFPGLRRPENVHAQPRVMELSQDRPTQPFFAFQSL